MTIDPYLTHLVHFDSVFELQRFDLGSLLTVTGLWPLTWLFTPTLKPTLCERLKLNPSPSCLSLTRLPQRLIESQ
jgi:hypothetical protein